MTERGAVRISRLKTRTRGQAMVEFVIALPILLFVIFGIIEFARLVFAWMAVQNAARFGIRYAVTGEFNDVYCVEAGNYLGAAYINADTDGGDPQDCKIPDTYTNADKADKERELIDIARLFSIQDAAVGGGTGLWLRPNVSGNYEQYLNNHNQAFLGLPNESGFYHITICSNRNNEFVMDYGNYAIPLCKDGISNTLMDDAGGPGDRVKVRVQHRHPLFLPLLSNIWPSLTLNAERDGIVEKFRTSRALGVSGPILSAPTWTQTPTITLTPTVTYTPTETPTPTPSATPVPVDCALIDVDYSFFGDLGGGFYATLVRIRNNNPVPIHLFRADVAWTQLPPSRYLNSMQFNFSPWVVLDDFAPDTAWVPAVPIELAAGGVGDHIALFKPVAEPLQGAHSVNLQFEDGCVKGVSDTLPTSTITLTPTVTYTPTVTPTPDCSAYSLSNFTFLNSAIQQLTVTNGDVVDTDVVQIQLDWDYAEDYGTANGYPNLNIDWFRWNGSYIHLGGNGDFIYDSSSPTTWSGSLPFNAGSSNTWQIDFDNDWAGGGALPGVVSNDFGVTIDFANGCQLVRNPVPRPIISWTPSSTPTVTWTPTPPPPPTATPLPTATRTPSDTPPPSATPSITNTPTITPTATKTLVPSATALPTNTVPAPTRTNTLVPSITPLPTNTRTPLPTNSPTPTPIPTWTPACPFDDPGWPCQPTWTPSP
jgi:hypothetical protein